MDSSFMNGARIAVAAAALLGNLAGCGDDTEEQQQAVKCQGINECKNMGDCAGTDGSTCKAMNACKGMGFKEVPTEAACTSKGGKVVK
jgi:hypothetical protein